MIPVLMNWLCILYVEPFVKLLDYSSVGFLKFSPLRWEISFNLIELFVVALSAGLLILSTCLVSRNKFSKVKSKMSMFLFFRYRTLNVIVVSFVLASVLIVRVIKIPCAAMLGAMRLINYILKVRR